MIRTVLLASLLAGCAAPPPTVRAVVEESDDETLPWVSELHVLTEMEGSVVDLDLTMPPGTPDNTGVGVFQGSGRLRCSAAGPLPRSEGDYGILVPAVASLVLIIPAHAPPPVCAAPNGPLRFTGRYRVAVTPVGPDGAEVRLTPAR